MGSKFKVTGRQSRTFLNSMARELLKEFEPKFMKIISRLAPRSGWVFKVTGAKVKVTGMLCGEGLPIDGTPMGTPSNAILPVYYAFTWFHSLAYFSCVTNKIQHNRAIVLSIYRKTLRIISYVDVGQLAYEPCIAYTGEFSEEGPYSALANSAKSTCDKEEDDDHR